MINLFIQRLITSISTIPNFSDCLATFALILLLALIALPVGFQQGFLEIKILKLPGQTIFYIITFNVLITAICEELFFRALFLPHPTENITNTILLLSIIFSWLCFLIYHPINALTFYPAGYPTFMNPIFLVLAGLLGIICTISYLGSGSIWTCVFIHWLVLLVWIILLGGYNKLAK